MASSQKRRWSLVAAVAFAIALTAVGTFYFTTQWQAESPPDDDDAVVDDRDEEDRADDAESERQIEPTDEAGADRELYDLPDRSGRCVVEHEGKEAGLPQLSADYEVDIRGDLATVHVTQTFENPTDDELEAIYEFPLYEKAAVYAMEATIGDRTIRAKIDRKEEAREKYEEAKAQGKKAALLDQDRPNLFTQSVASIGAGEEVEVRLSYTHPLPRNKGTYWLAVPFAVPERFAPADMEDNKLVDSDGDDPGASPGGADGDRTAEGPEDVSLTVRIDGGMPVADISETSHTLEAEQLSETAHRLELVPDEDAVDRHFRLGYRLAGDEPQVGLNSYWDDEDEQGYFDLLIEPPAEVAAEQVPNREMVFVIDQSGSMRGERIEAARDFIADALDHLRPDDRFQIITFSNRTGYFYDEPRAATPENIDDAKRGVRKISAGGGTMMEPALAQALESEIPEETMRLVTLVTDVKVANEFEVMKTVRKEIGESRMFTLGMGGSANRYLLDELGRLGRGFSKQIDVGDDHQSEIDDAVRRLQNPVLTDISVDWGDLEVDSVSPDPIPDVYEGGSVRIHGRYDEPGAHDIAVEGTLGGEPVTYDKSVELADSPNDGESVKLAWARKRIEDLMHELVTPRRLRADKRDDDQIKEAITEIGLGYSLTTQWTSFVAVDEDAEVYDGQQAAREPEPERAVNAQRKQRQVRGRPKSPAPSRGGSGGPAPAEAMGLFAKKKEDKSGRSSGRTSAADNAASGEPDASADIETKWASEAPDGVDDDALKASFDKHANLLEGCFERAARRGDVGAGKVELKVTFQPDANRPKVDVVDDAVGSQIAQCVSKQTTRKVTFDHSGEEPLEAKVTITFEKA
ncbi:MAG: VIT domain-containing protein [Persicimonas sp.]